MPYVFSDHPSFPEGTLKRSLEIRGFTVGVIETPYWQDPQSFTQLGKPALFFAIISGPVDSIVLNYTSTRKRRQEDLYQHQGEAFFKDSPLSIKYKIRPDNTVLVFANRIRQVYKEVPIVIGGIEAALRKFAYYHFQENQVRRSILLDSRADLLVTGMGEKQIVEIANRARAGVDIRTLDLPGTARLTKDVTSYPHYVILPSLDQILANPSKLVEAALETEKGINQGKGLIQAYDHRYVIEHPPAIYTTTEIDTIYDFPYTRLHSNHKTLTPALQMNLFSITSHRGCGGGCAFCSISMHEGKRIISRSQSSIINEIQSFKKHPQWKGIVGDIGGATAELYQTDCSNPSCRRVSCLIKDTCPSIGIGEPFLKLLKQAREIPGVRKVFLGSGIRYDIVLKNPQLLEEILLHHSGKFLRVAPEHTQDSVLNLMRKPTFEVFEQFVQLFRKINDRLPRKVELSPYLIIGYPGETQQDVIAMAQRLRKMRIKTTDVQIFTPTPGTLSTAMYYSGVSMAYEPIPIEKNIKNLEKRKQILASKE